MRIDSSSPDKQQSPRMEYTGVDVSAVAVGFLRQKFGPDGVGHPNTNTVNGSNTLNAKFVTLEEYDREHGFTTKEASLDPLIAGFWVFLGSSCKGFREIDRGFRVLDLDVQEGPPP